MKGLATSTYEGFDDSEFNNSSGDEGQPSYVKTADLSRRHSPIALREEEEEEFGNSEEEYDVSCSHLSLDRR